MPSISGGAKSLSWWCDDSIMALQRCSVRDNLSNSWLIASLSSEPLLLANAAAICFTWTTAPAWNPPPRSPRRRAGTRDPPVDRLPQCPWASAEKLWWERRQVRRHPPHLRLPKAAKRRISSSWPWWMMIIFRARRWQGKTRWFLRFLCCWNSAMVMMIVTKMISGWKSFHCGLSYQKKPSTPLRKPSKFGGACRKEPPESFISANLWQVEAEVWRKNSKYFTWRMRKKGTHW